MNITSKGLTLVKTLPVKSCAEISFANGGHLFACVAKQTEIHVYNFYTLECPQHMQYVGHQGQVQCIAWFENDMGFSTCGKDGNIYFYDLNNYKLDMQQKRNQEKDVFSKGKSYSSLALMPGKQYEAYAVGSDTSITSTARTDTVGLERCLSSLQILKSGKALIAGVGQPGFPGSIQIWKFPLETLKDREKPLLKILEIQAHSSTVTAIKLTEDNKSLISVGADGMLCIFDVKAENRDLIDPFLSYANEIMTEKSDIEGALGEKESLLADLEGLKDESENKVSKDLHVKREVDNIYHLREELANNEKQFKEREASLSLNIKETIKNNENKTKELLDRQQQEVEDSRNYYAKKMLEDAARFQELQSKKDEENRNFQLALENVKAEHLKLVSIEEDRHRKEMEIKTTQIEQ